MKKTLLCLLFTLILSTPASAVVYAGGSYGLGVFSAEPLEKYRVSTRGYGYGGFLGVGKDFVGLEGFYQSLPATGKIKHDGGSHDITTNATALGAALRFGFHFFYLRLGVASFQVNQSLSISDDTSREAANQIYEIEESARKSGVLYGAGLHRKLGDHVRCFIDYTRYQVTGVGEYDTISAGLSFNIPERFLGFTKF